MVDYGLCHLMPPIRILLVPVRDYDYDDDYRSATPK